ncbi:DUF6542 domain-containing protein [Streptomyces sp. NPDC051561]|uniref:DUF6542 domain-containing protein n=1 Tax=Streptomyces sp. NPDC051561 TaxID=3365658 RepID=UPI0037A882BF
MEQPRTRPRPPQRRPHHIAAQGVTAETSTVYRGSVRPARPVAPVVLALRRLPNPRLTGLGGGLFASLSMVVLALLDRLLFDGSPVVYGVLFLPVSVLTALWVRPADLVTAPVSLPIAFVCGLVPIAGGSDGVGSRFMAVVTALAVHAGWLYGGTLGAGLIVGVRKIRLVGQRRRARAHAPAAVAPAAAEVPAVAAAGSRPQAAPGDVRTRPKPAAVRRQRPRSE